MEISNDYIAQNKAIKKIYLQNYFKKIMLIFWLKINKLLKALILEISFLLLINQKIFKNSKKL